MTPLALIAGEGALPVMAAASALKQGFPLRVYALDRGNIKALRRVAEHPSHVHYMAFPGLFDQHAARFHADGVGQAVFAGKVNKWILVRAPLLDRRAMGLWKAQRAFNDDAVMHALIGEFEAEGIEVLPQTRFISDLLVMPGVYSQRPPTPDEIRDADLGMTLAKEMGRLDIGQTVVVHQGMVLAVEAIEGTDQAICRAGRWKKGIGGVVAKVEKPSQDHRFDLPTVGPRTLKAMRRSGLRVLAVEAHKTLVLEQDELIRLADRWQMTFMAQ
jgi:DUF1009 family protein